MRQHALARSLTQRKQISIPYTVYMSEGKSHGARERERQRDKESERERDGERERETERERERQREREGESARERAESGRLSRYVA